MAPRSLADQQSAFVKARVPVKIKRSSLVAVTVKKSSVVDAAASQKLFDALAK